MTTAIVVLMGALLVVGLARSARDAIARDRTRALSRVQRVLPGRPRAIVAAALVRADVSVSPEAAVRWWLPCQFSP